MAEPYHRQHRVSFRPLNEYTHTIDVNGRLRVLTINELEKVAARRVYDFHTHGPLIVNEATGMAFMANTINAMVFTIGDCLPFTPALVTEHQYPVVCTSFTSLGSRLNTAAAWNIPSAWQLHHVGYSSSLKAVVDALKTIEEMLDNGEAPFIDTFVISVGGPCRRIVNFLARTSLTMGPNTHHMREEEAVGAFVLGDRGHYNLCMEMLRRLEQLEQLEQMHSLKVLFRPSNEGSIPRWFANNHAHRSCQRLGFREICHKSQI